MKAILLAAGKSSRMWPLAQHKNKCMYEFLGKPLISYTIEGLKSLGLKEIIIVVSPDDNSIKNYFGDGKKYGLKIDYTVQKDPLGTGNALLSACHLLNEPFILTNAGKANVSTILRPMLDAYEKTKDAVLASRETDKPWKYGILKTSADRVLSIVEKPKTGQEPSRQKVEGVYILTPGYLKLLEKTENGENSLEEAMQQYLDKKHDVRFIKIDNLPEFTLKYPWDMFAINKALLDTMITPRISKAAKIHKTVIIEGVVIIEDNVTIYDNVTIKGPCYIGESTVIGKNAQIREYASIGKNCVVGYGTDIKSSILSDDVKADLCFIGDSILDEGVRLGAGTITANRRLDRGTVTTITKEGKVDTGLSSFGSVIGKDSKTGIHVGLMPGTKIGSNSLVWPHVVVLKDVPDNSTVMQETKNLVQSK